MQIAPGTYYDNKSRSPSLRSITDVETLAEIRRVHEDNYGVYGIKKVWAQLGREGGVGGRHVACCTVGRLMKDAGLRGVSRAKSPTTARWGPGLERRSYLVDREFTTIAPNQLSTPNAQPSTGSMKSSPADIVAFSG